MPLSMVTVTGGANGWSNPDGTVPVGQVMFQPLQSLTGGGYILAAEAVTASLVNGNISKQLANNTQITSLQYLVTEQIVGAQNPAPYVITPAGTSLDLSTAYRGPVGPANPLYVLSSDVTVTHSHVIAPSGDTTGATDTNAINASLIANAHTVLGPGQFYVTNVGLTTNSRWLQGSGIGTVLNVLPGSTGVTVTGPGQVCISDLEFKNGAYGIVVNGCYDGTFRDLFFTGQTSGGVKINGDAATEQHWTDVVMRTVGGIAFDLERTTTIYTGSLYLDRVRIVTPPAGAHGFRFNSTAPAASLNTVFMTECVADDYTRDAYAANNVAQVFVTNSWFAINASSTAGSAAMRITGGFQHSYTGCYTYTGLAGGACVVATGAINGVAIDGGHVFDGAAGNTALNLTGAAAGGFNLGTYLTYCGTLTNTPNALAGTSRVIGAPTFYTNGSGTSSQVIGVVDTANPTGNTKYIRNGNGQLQVVNAAFNATILALTDAGLLIVPSLQLTTPLPIASGGTGSGTQNFVDLTTAQTVSGAKTFNSKLSVQAANVSVQNDGTHVDVVSTGSAQYDGPGAYLWNSAATLGNQAGVSIQAGIADAGATKGYVTIAQLNNTGGFVQNLVNFDLNAGTASFSGPVIAPGYATASAQKTASYTATAADSTILGNATSAPITITLPTAAGIAGRQYTVKKTDASVNAVTLGTTAAQTIDGTTTKALTAQYAAFTVQSDGTNWQIIGKV